MKLGMVHPRRRMPSLNDKRMNETCCQTRMHALNLNMPVDQ
jgi:hypothetical protein